MERRDIKEVTFAFIGKYTMVCLIRLEDDTEYCGSYTMSKNDVIDIDRLREYAYSRCIDKMIRIGQLIERREASTPETTVAQEPPEVVGENMNK